MQDYFLLSRIDNGIFVYHNIIDTTSDDKGISYFIYHVLKSNNIIDNDNVNVFIYEHDIIKKTCDLIILQNKEKGELEEFDKENLENIFNEIIENIVNNNNNTVTISYDNNNYTTTYKEFTFNKDDKLVLDTIEYIAM